MHAKCQRVLTMQAIKIYFSTKVISHMLVVLIVTIILY